MERKARATTCLRIVERVKGERHTSTIDLKRVKCEMVTIKNEKDKSH